MKREINIQQLKDHGKNPQDQTSEEEIDSLPEKRIQSNKSNDDPKALK